MSDYCENSLHALGVIPPFSYRLANVMALNVDHYILGKNMSLDVLKGDSRIWKNSMFFYLIVSVS